MATATAQPKGELAQEYERLKPARQPFLDRARANAKLTIPALCPEEGDNSYTTYKNPAQDSGAEGVNHLAAKLLTTLFPTQTTFFKYTLEESVIQEAEEAEKANPQLRAAGGSIRGSLEKKLLERERIIQDYVEQKAFRVQLGEVFKYLIVTGNALLRFTTEGGLKIHKLATYVVERDASGNVLQVITHENISFRALPDEIQARISARSPDLIECDKLNLYTRWKLDRMGDKWDTIQEVAGLVVEETKGDFVKDELPVIPLRWTAQTDESYGRSMVEDHMGSLESLEILTDYVNATARAAAKTIFLVNPMSVTKPRELAKVPNLGFVEGKEGDIRAFGIEKLQEMRIAEARIDKLERKLAAAFLMNSSVQRDAERVTAEEIRYLVQELQTAFGGVYSVFSQELQLPLLKHIEATLRKDKKLWNLPADTVRPIIVTGIEALGRGHSLDGLMQFLTIAERLGDEGLAEINKREVELRAATYLGVDTDGLLKTQAEKDAEKQREAELMRQQQTTDLIKPAVPAIAQGAVAGMAAEGG